jgi:hypothetical protein
MKELRVEGVATHSPIVELNRAVAIARAEGGPRSRSSTLSGEPALGDVSLASERARGLASIRLGRNAPVVACPSDKEIEREQVALAPVPTSCFVGACLPDTEHLWNVALRG